ncbi:MAG: flagellar hook-basal body complex protein FliE [Spirochaetaceae bacterium]|jgi:flagellar hook-basal body complex protein FliE|nr:flagellar hook-basal body complex protein FliE [Spirochaetaceae bacterium]
MTIYRPELVHGDKVPMKVTHPRHMVPVKGEFSIGGKTVNGRGALAAELGDKIGAEAVLRAGTFEDAMLRAVDKVSATENFAAALAQKAIVDPDSIDPHDLTIAQAEAQMSLNITRTILNRIVQGWRDLINTR